MTLPNSEKVCVRTFGKEAPHVQWAFKNRADQDRGTALCGFRPQRGWRGWRKAIMSIAEFYSNPPRVCLKCKAALRGDEDGTD